jgi:hypothetical protein
LSFACAQTLQFLLERGRVVLGLGGIHV